MLATIVISHDLLASGWLHSPKFSVFVAMCGCLHQVHIIIYLASCSLSPLRANSSSSVFGRYALRPGFVLFRITLSSFLVSGLSSDIYERVKRRDARYACRQQAWGQEDACGVLPRKT